MIRPSCRDPLMKVFTLGALSKPLGTRDHNIRILSSPDFVKHRLTCNNKVHDEIYVGGEAEKITYRHTCHQAPSPSLDIRPPYLWVVDVAVQCLVASHRGFQNNLSSTS